MNWVAKQEYANKSYIVGEKRIKRPYGRVEGTEFELDSDSMSALETTNNVWNYMIGKGLENPSKPDKILKRLFRSQVCGNGLTLFSPWGPRYGYKIRGTRIKEGDPEVRTLEEIGDVLDKLDQMGCKQRLKLMLADKYGIDINGLPSEVVYEYFESLKEEAEKVFGDSIDLVTWSGICRELESEYGDLRSEVEENLGNYVNPGIMKNLIRISGRFNPDNPERAAREYAIERVTEGILVDRAEEPVKLSLVEGSKDNLDGPLPRIYLIRNKAPWMVRR